MKTELERYDLVCSSVRIAKTAKIFRRLGETYQNIQGNERVPAAVSEQLSVMADVLEECCGTKSKKIIIENAHENDIIKGLASKGIKAKNLRIFERDPNRKEIVVMARMLRHGCVTTKDMAMEISRYFDYDFYSSENNKSIVNDKFNEYTFVQEPRFRVLFGMSKRSKDSYDVSGDSFSVSQFECGKVITTLVDGMGTGTRAFSEGEAVIDLMEQCLEAGFEEKTAIGLINAAFSAGSLIGNPVAVDMCVIDRYLGVLTCIKLGAASTVIKRDGWVEIIKSTTLPIGVLEQVDFDSTVKKLYDNDYIIMVSDGVLENLPYVDKEAKLVEIISKLEVKQPEAMADEIIREALSYNKMVAKDDMTVIVAGVFDTHGKVY